MIVPAAPSTLPSHGGCVSRANRYSLHDAQAEIDGCHQEIAHLEAVYHTRHAQAEALAGALREALEFVEGCATYGATDTERGWGSRTLRRARAVLACLPAQAFAERRALGASWTRVCDVHPPRHEKSIVRRDNRVFTATPCYGLHVPWWVVTTMGGEAPPEEMLDADTWILLTDFLTALDAVRGEET